MTQPEEVNAFKFFFYYSFCNQYFTTTFLATKQVNAPLDSGSKANVFEVLLILFQHFHTTISDTDILGKLCWWYTSIPPSQTMLYNFSLSTSASSTFFQSPRCSSIPLFPFYDQRTMLVSFYNCINVGLSVAFSRQSLSVTLAVSYSY